MKLKFLGTSDSAGMPVHNCKCKACEYHRKHNIQNYPTSAYIEFENNVIMLDAGRDDACWLFDGKKIDAIFLTHFHADHAYGLLRLRYSQTEIPTYHPKDEKGFDSLYKQPHRLSFTCNTPFKPIHVKNISFIPIPLIHSKNTNGYLIITPKKVVAYLTDCSEIPEESMNFLNSYDIDAIFLDGCYAPDFDGNNHLNYIEAEELISKLNPKDGYLIHACHQALTHLLENPKKSKYSYIENNFSYDLE